MGNKDTIKLGIVFVLVMLALSVTVGCATGARAQGEEWNKTFGGSDFESASSVQQTADGGFILAGCTESYGAGEEDAWLVKTDPDGNMEWEKTFGGSDFEVAASVQQTTDGGFILAGWTVPCLCGYCDPYEKSDVLLVKTDPDGNMEWEKTFGGSDFDWGLAVQQTADSGYILCGYTTTCYGSCSYLDDFDVLLVKTDPDGNMEWNKIFGGTGRDEAYSVQQTAGGGFILAGCTDSYGAGEEDVWLVKTNSKGNKQWDMTFGGSDFDGAKSLQQTADGGYILAGETKSYGTVNVELGR
jgi:hypothetical protein